MPTYLLVQPVVARIQKHSAASSEAAPWKIVSLPKAGEMGWKVFARQQLSWGLGRGRGTWQAYMAGLGKYGHEEITRLGS